MKKIAVIVYGPPGSGKGTQANILARKLNLLHFDTGRFLEDLVHDPENQRNKTIHRERILFDKGMLMTPSFVLHAVSNTVKKLWNAGWGVVFSGSPRTIYEATGLIPVLSKFYGKKNIHVFILSIPQAVSMKRNIARLTCSTCGHTLLTEYRSKKTAVSCPICAGSLYKRVLDNSKVMKTRLEEYKKRTLPIIQLLKKKRYHISMIDARPAPHVVFKKIYDQLKNA